MSFSAPPDRSHINWVDPCKGIGITAIVLGHTLAHGVITSFLFLFHVPLFFFLSGYLHKPQPRLGEYLRRKSYHLLLPYFAFLVVLAAPDLIHLVHHGGSFTVWFEELLWGGNEVGGAHAVFWFVSCLFLTQQLMNLLLVKFRLPSVTLIAVCFLAASYANTLIYPLRLPLDANVVLAAAPFFLAGHLCRKFQMPKWIGAAGAVLAIAAVVLLYFGMPVSYDMKYTKYGVPGVTFLLSLGCIFAILGLSRAIVQYPAASQFFGALGSASMGIMYLHELVLIYIAPARRFGDTIAFMVALGLSFGITRALASRHITRIVFLGEKPQPVLAPVTA